MRKNKNILIAGSLLAVASYIFNFLFMFSNIEILKLNKFRFYYLVLFGIVLLFSSIIFLIVGICKKFKVKGKGISYACQINSLTEDEFGEYLIPIIASLRDLKYEHLLLEFEGELYGDMKFIQTAYYDKYYLVEIGLTEKGESKLYRIKDIGLKDVLIFFYAVCIDCQVPNFSMWEDVSYLIKKQNKEDIKED